MLRRDRHRWDAKSTLGWGALFYVLTQIAINVFIDGWHPELYHAEFGARIALLEDRIAENPGRPLLVTLGSSRVTMNYLPEELPPLYTPEGERVLPFNFAHLGSGPATNLLLLRRLLRRGIHPDWLVVEIMPTALNDWKQGIFLDAAEVRDMPTVARHKTPVCCWANFVRARVSTCYKQRAFLVHNAVPRWLPPDAKLEQDSVRLGPLGGDYDWCAVVDPDAKTIHDRTEYARNGYVPPLQNGFQVQRLSDSAWQELLTLCRDEGIPVVLLLCPEGPLFQSWYPPATRKLIDDYCTGLSRDHGVPLVDARDWLDEAAFVDSPHPPLKGARRFTRRLGSDVLPPLVEGKLRYTASRA